MASSIETGADTGSGTAATALWRLETIPGKGKGLVATGDISPGTLILSDAPLITTDVIKSIESTEQDLARALKALPKESQRAYLSLHNNYPGKNPLSNIVRSNGYPLGPGSDVGGVFANVSRINHSCRPNAKHSWNPTLQKQTVYAIRPIAAGEELSLSYLSGGTYSERQEQLKNLFGFSCACELCTLPPDDRRASDNRIRRAQKLNESIGDWDKCRYSPAQVLRQGRELMALYREEGIVDDHLPNLYYDIFQVCNMHGDQARASAFASKYCELKRLSEGPESANVREAMPYVADPRKHKGFGKTQDWKTDLDQIPKGLDDEDFEKWLWREKV
ncbi:hypothetical protein M430DRAFT_32646 [Amorphotheca resinae ATCC 22711]|jgi:hypothetical protein|uniref:SET domain-containing protein n=1 Tax=Amorphotheca resinae ATCC 22711 TaxID=857342 RepID=A0A2T3BFR8_AMORE|nr:hypothetical protein M430DRAFT_32646 [Amorphotheca resinae ATCC 22711]PSS28173.1 hypothetical protein M430DRAFT_32646 [Amorphotheca resinae ATCC 22711]